MCPKLCTFSISSQMPDIATIPSSVTGFIYLVMERIHDADKTNYVIKNVWCLQFSFIRHANSNFCLVRVTHGANVALNVVMRDLSTQRSHFAFSVELLLISSHSQSLGNCWQKRHFRVSRK